MNRDLYGTKTDSKVACEVCGDKARGNNFDAITCASCKEFFRRNAYKEKVNFICQLKLIAYISIYQNFKCYFQGNCRIDIVSRRFCAFCRLKKCFAVGMKREYILSQDEREARRMRMSEKRQLKQQLSDDSLSFSYNKLSLYNEYSLLPSNSQEISAQNQEETMSLVQDYFKLKINDSLSLIIDNNTNLDSSSKQESLTLLNRIKLVRESNYYPIKYQLLSRAKNAKKMLQPEEKHLLKQLTCKVQLMQVETLHELPCNEMYIDVIKFIEIITKNLIKMCKKLEDFQSLSSEDQISLIKGSCMEALILRAIMALNLEKECWESLVLIIELTT